MIERSSLLTILSLLLVAQGASSWAGVGRIEGGAGEGAPADVEQRTATLTGKVVEAGTREPLQAVIVRLSNTDIETETDEYGEFRLGELAPGRVIVKIATPGYKGYTADLILMAGETYRLRVYLYPRAERQFAMTVETQREDGSGIEHSLLTSEAGRLPGSFGDAVRSVLNLPGVLRSPYSFGWLIIRGTSPEDSGFLVEGVPVLNLFHFGGVKASINSSEIKRIDYLPGGYSVRYGRLLGGIVNIDLKDSFQGPMHGYADVNVIDATLFLQGMAGKKLSYAISARRSYVDLVLEPFVVEKTGYQVRAPRYWDAQLRIGYDLGRRTHINALLLSSNDDFAILGRDVGDEVDYETREPTAVLDTRFSRLLLDGETVFSPTLKHSLVFSLGPDETYFKYGSTYTTDKPFQVALRDEWIYRVSDELELMSGLDLQVTKYNIENEDFQFDEPAWGYFPAVYLELEYKPTSSSRLRPGIRLDQYRIPSKEYLSTLLSFRLAGDWDIGSSTELNASIRQLNQPPDSLAFFSVEGGALAEKRAVQATVGVRHQVSPLLTVKATAYFTGMYDLLTAPSMPYVSIEDFLLGSDETVLELPAYTNSGIGRAYGIELLVRRHFGDRWFGWISYTLNRSERKSHAQDPLSEILFEWGENARWQGTDCWEQQLYDVVDSSGETTAPEKDSPRDPYYVFDYDQPHVLTVAGSYEFAQGWQAGLRFRFASGNPYTPFTNRVYIVDTGGYRGLDDPCLGLNHSRLSAFHSLDLQIAKTMVFDTWKLTLSLDLQNAYNRQNIETWYYPHDYGEELWYYSLPILPVLGVKGEF